MRICEHCGARLDLMDTLFCPYCGTAHDLETPRLAEAISIEIVGDEAAPILPYGTRLPASYSDVFSTSTDGQETVHVHLVVGNSRKASACRSMLSLTFPIEERGPRGVPRVNVTVRVDATGRLGVLAHEQGTDNRFERDDLLVAVAATRSSP